MADDKNVEVEAEIKALKEEEVEEVKADEEAEEVSVDDNEPPKFSVKFQLLATLLIVFCALGGGILGVILFNIEASGDAISWIGLPGDLFIRALRCVVLPLVFVNVILAVIQMVQAGKAGAIGRYTVGIYVLTTLIASIEGMVAVAIFQDQFSFEEGDIEPTFIRLQCPDDGWLAETSEGEVFCKATNDTEDSSTFWEFSNVNGYFETTGDDFNIITFSDTLQDGIFRKLIPDNIVKEFADGGFVGVVMFGIVFGAASQSLKKKPKVLLDFLQDINDIMVRIIEWVIYLTPIAVFSLIAGALAGVESLDTVFSDIGVLLTASILAIIVHVLIVYPGLFYLFVRENPYAYLRFIIPAQIFAFACASSAATLPVTLRCVKETGQVPDSIRDFVLPIGATINMDGTALYFPPAIVFLAKTAGLEVGGAEYFLIILVSTIGSAGAAPVPNAGLVLIVTAFNTVFTGSGVPQNFGIIVGIDWLMDRFQTALNITGDSFVARIVTHVAGLDIKGDQPTSELVASGEEEQE